jgi:hypothetical protein
VNEWNEEAGEWIEWVYILKMLQHTPRDKVVAEEKEKSICVSIWVSYFSKVVNTAILSHCIFVYLYNIAVGKYTFTRHVNFTTTSLTLLLTLTLLLYLPEITTNHSHTSHTSQFTLNTCVIQCEN